MYYKHKIKVYRNEVKQREKYFGNKSNRNITDTNENEDQKKLITK